MTALTLDSQSQVESTMSSGYIIGKLSTSETIPFEIIKKYIERLHADQIKEFIEDLVYSEGIDITKKAMSFKILYKDFVPALFPGEKGKGIHALWMYYARLSNTIGSSQSIATRVGGIIDNKQATMYTKKEIEKILFREPFAMDGAEINKICKTLGITEDII